MKKAKTIGMMILYIIIFILAEIIGTILTLIYKMKTNLDFIDELYNTLMTLDVNNPDSYANYLKLCYQLVPMTLLITGIIILIPFSIYCYHKKIQVIQKIPIKQIFFLICIGISLNVIVSLIIELLPQNLIDNYSANVNYIEELPPFALLVTAGIIAPLIEEIIFRFFMVNKLKKKPVIAVIIPALMFGIAHGNIVQGTYAFLLGTLFGYIYLKTGNLLYTIILHASINSSSILFTIIPEIVSYIGIIFSIIISLYCVLRYVNYSHLRKS